MGRGGWCRVGEGGVMKGGEEVRLGGGLKA